MFLRARKKKNKINKKTPKRRNKKILREGTKKQIKESQRIFGKKLQICSYFAKKNLGSVLTRKEKKRKKYLHRKSRNILESTSDI
jgi:hypothetical protein